MDVGLFWVLCVVRYASVKRADHSSRGVLPSVVHRHVWSRRPWTVLGFSATRKEKSINNYMTQGLKPSCMLFPMKIWKACKMYYNWTKALRFRSWAMLLWCKITLTDWAIQFPTFYGIWKFIILFTSLPLICTLHQMTTDHISYLTSLKSTSVLSSNLSLSPNISKFRNSTLYALHFLPIS